MGTSSDSKSSEKNGSQQTRRRPASSSITNYFLLILCLFGILTAYVNIQHGGIDQHQTIDGFQDKHLVKTNSASRKKYEKIDADEKRSSNQEPKVALNKESPESNDEPAVDAQPDEQLQHQLAGLNCDVYGGPSKEIAQEMVYWEDIPSDNTFRSPFEPIDGTKQYITFESDHGGWNNIRMAMETVMTIAVATGRTLVLPPEQGMYLLHHSEREGTKQRKDFSYSHFFHMESIAEEHRGLEVITMKEFLEREGKTGGLRNVKSGEVQFPPKNRTDFDGARHNEISTTLEKYLRGIAVVPSWDPEKCLLAFPSSTDDKDRVLLEEMFQTIKSAGFPKYEDYVGKPTDVDGPAIDRMKENWAGRGSLCIYDKNAQEAKVLHFSHGQDGSDVGARLLVHFYAFLFFEDWKQDLWMKRFVRDHVRYIDEIQCAAARVVAAIRERARSRDPKGNPEGFFHAFHIRRGDFQYKVTRFEAPRILKMSQPELPANSTVYIATDEKDREFFKALAEFYDVVFLDDFKDAVADVNSNYFGMMDQLIASRSKLFFGCWFSTFTGYINRLRGYTANKEKEWKGYEQGLVPSYYYALEDRKFHMQEFYPVKKSFYAREFPASWRNIDKGIGELQHLEINKK